MSDELLERRYRRLLRILPKSYREARGEELLSTLMDGAEEGRTRPEPREVLSLARLGVRARMGRAADGRLATTGTGEMVRAVALAGTILLVFVGLTQLALIAGNMRSDPGAHFSWSHPAAVMFGSRQDERFDILPYEIPALWTVVLGLVSAGWWPVARLAALAVFLESAYLTRGMELALREETVLAGIVTAALFAARGVHARRALVPGLLSAAVLLTIGGVVYKAQEAVPPGKASRIPVRALGALQGYGGTENRHAMLLAALLMLVVGAVGYQSSAWPVGLAVVAVAAIGPDLVLVSQRPFFPGGNGIPLAFLAGGLVLLAALAVFRELRAGRSAGSEARDPLAG